jgi:hypothetical protein
MAIPRNESTKVKIVGISGTMSFADSRSPGEESSGTVISSARSVIAIAKTPSLSCSNRVRYVLSMPYSIFENSSLCHNRKVFV